MSESSYQYSDYNLKQLQKLLPAGFKEWMIKRIAQPYLSYIPFRVSNHDNFPSLIEDLLPQLSETEYKQFEDGFSRSIEYWKAQDGYETFNELLDIAKILKSPGALIALVVRLKSLDFDPSQVPGLWNLGLVLESMWQYIVSFEKEERHSPYVSDIGRMCSEMLKTNHRAYRILDPVLVRYASVYCMVDWAKFALIISSRYVADADGGDIILPEDAYCYRDSSERKGTYDFDKAIVDIIPWLDPTTFTRGMEFLLNSEEPQREDAIAVVRCLEPYLYYDPIEDGNDYFVKASKKGNESFKRFWEFDSVFIRGELTPVVGKIFADPEKIDSKKVIRLADFQQPETSHNTGH